MATNSGDTMNLKISREVHEMLVKHCLENDLKIAKFVEKLIKNNINI